MQKKKSLKYYIQQWKEYFSADVEGQTIKKQHLSEKKLRELAQPFALEKSISDADFEHLSVCPSCLEQWARFCKRNEGNKEDRIVGKTSMTYGTYDEDDVMGQSAVQHLSSTCGHFILSLSRLEDSSSQLAATLKTVEPSLKNHRVQVRDKGGRILLQGALDPQEFSAVIADTDHIDLSVWTVITTES